MAILAAAWHPFGRRRRGAALAASLLLLGVACTSRDRALFDDGDRSERDSTSLAAVEPSSATRRAPPPVGVVADVDGLRVLRMRGTPRELGYQHGKAFAAEILEGFEQFVLGYRCHGMKARYAQITKRLENEIDFPPRLLEELDGMVEGMAASGVDTTVSLLKRPLARQDLLALNTIDHWGLFGCSGFTAWGPATDDGGVMVTRNFDFDVDQPEQAIARLNVVLAFEPEGGIPFVSLAFPGLVGVTTGLSARGVGAFLHVGNGPFGGGDPGRTVPLLAIARELVEQCGPERVAAAARERLGTARIRNSFLFRVTTDGRDAPPTTVFEVDPLGVGEEPLPDPKRGEAPVLFATNHFVARATTFPAIPDSRIRWCSLEECATTALGGGDRRIGPDEAWSALGRVKQTRNIVTLHALVWRPATGELWLGVSERVDGHVVAATDGERRHLWLSELLDD